MNYKLVNKENREEIICDKIIIDGFDYYIGFGVGDIKEHHICVYGTALFLVEIILIKDNKLCIKGKFVKDMTFCEFDSFTKLNKIIATNNEQIGEPQIVTEWIINWEDINNKLQNVGGVNPYAYEKGFKKSKQIYPYNADELIEFGLWFQSNFIQHSVGCYEDIKTHKLYKHKDEIIDYWNENRIITLYFNESKS